MSLPADTLWYNGDWNLFVGIHPVGEAVCPCDPSATDIDASTACASRPPNQLNEPSLLMGTYTDFDVTDAFGWNITGLYSNNFTTLPIDVLTTLSATFEIRSDVSAYDPGVLIDSGTATPSFAFRSRTIGAVVSVTPTGRTAISDSILYTEYTFLVTGLSVSLPFGKYWMNVAPILTAEVITDFGSDFLIFNSTTDGVNSVGVPAGNNANDFFVVGNPDPTTYFIPSNDFGTEYHDFSNGVTGRINPICIDPNMQVTLQNDELVRIRDLKEGALLRTTDINCPAKLVINYRNDVGHKVLIKILPNAIKQGVPNKTLYITANHPILVDGEYKKPRDLINGNTVSRSRRSEPVNTHTLVTDNGKPVMINGVPVSTWNIKRWKKLPKLPQEKGPFNRPAASASLKKKH